MLRWLPAPLRGIITIGFFYLETLVLGTSFMLFLLVYALMPIPVLRRQLKYFCNEFPRYWGGVTGWFNQLMLKTQVEVRGLEGLHRKGWYLMISNHQSFSDILLLHHVFNKHVSPMRFFMKQSLKFLPVAGQVCMALGYPFMRRYTKEQIVKNPALKGKDIEETKKACERFKTQPITIINFAEGTRYTKAKADRQQSPYQFLLKPKAGGIAFTLAAMSEVLQKIIHVTIVYDGKRSVTFWDYYSGKIKRVIVDVKIEPIHEDIIGDYVNDRSFRVHFQGWLNKVWQEKDQRIAELKNEFKSELNE